MINHPPTIDVSELWSRKRADLLKNREWHHQGERLANTRELIQRRHYLNALVECTGHPYMLQAGQALTSTTTGASPSNIQGRNRDQKSTC